MPNESQTAAAVNDRITRLLGAKDIQIAQMQVKIEELTAEVASLKAHEAQTLVKPAEDIKPAPRGLRAS